MKKLLLCLLSICSIVNAGFAKSEKTASQQPQPFLFTENKGQVHDQYGNAASHVLFTLAEGSFKAQLTATGIHYYFQKINNPEVVERQKPKMPEPGSKISEKPEMPDTTPISYTIYRMEVELVGANPHPVIERGAQSGYYENYYLPGCGEKGVTQVHGFETVTYKDVYPGIDWIVYAKGGTIKYDFLVHAGANPALIKLRYKGADRLALNKDGSFTAKTALGSITEVKPYSYLHDNKHVVASKFVLSNNELSFLVSRQQQDMVIDPVIDWGTYVYGNGTVNYQYSLYADGLGSVYTSNYTNSTANMATIGAYQTVFGGTYDAALIKFNSAGQRLWATYFGGSNQEYYTGVNGDGGSNVFLSGFTYSNNNIATVGAHQTTLGGLYDVYLAKFSSAGVLSWATYYGGSNLEYASTTDCDAAGNIFLSGYTTSTNDIATTGSYQPAIAGSNDAFLVKFNSAGVRQWGTYFGGTAYEYGASVTCSNTGDVYITGSTASTTGIATAGSHQTVFGGGSYDAYLAKFTTSGSLLWSTYYGGLLQDGNWNAGSSWGNRAVECDIVGNVYMTSSTYSTNAIATAGAYQTALSGNYDAFLVKFNSAGVRQWATYFGGPNWEYASLATDNTGNYVYISGQTGSSTGIATPGAYQTVFAGGSYDAFFSKFNAAGSLLWSSYYGGTSYEWGNCLDYETSTGAFYIGGSTNSNTSIATPGSFQSTYSGTSNYDGFLVRFLDSVYYLKTDTFATQYCVGDSIHIPFHSPAGFAAGNVFTAQLSNASGSFGTPLVLGTKTSTAQADTIHAQLPLGVSGTGYKIRITSTIPAYISDTVSLVINPLVNPVVTISASNTSVCPTGTVTFTASVTNGGTAPVYQWWKNGSPAGTNTATYTANSWATGDSVYCTILGNAPCSANPHDTSNAIHITVLPVVVPTIAITSFGLTICPGQPISFTATITNGGTAPAYQWKRNGANVGTSSATYTASNFANGDVVTCVLTSSVPCAIPAAVTSNALTVVIATVLPTITITTNDTFFCYGRPATFTVTSVNNGGTTPVYQWMKNGVNVGPNALVYKDSFFVNGDIITCKLTSSNPCALPSQVVSNAIVLNVSPILNPIIIRINNNTLKVNTSVNPSFVFFQWYLNNSPIPGATTQTIQITQNGLYQVWVTDTSGCKAVSAQAWIQNLSVNSNISKAQVKVYPNPSTGIVMIDAPEKLNVSVRNILGQTVLNEEQTNTIDISALAPGVYTLMLSDKAGRLVETVKLTKND